MADSSYPLASDQPKESRSQQVVIIQSAMLGLSSLAVIGRIWIRLALVNTRLAADDWAIMVSLAFAVAFVADVITQTKYGLGQHIADLPPDTNFSESLKLFYIGEAIYYVTVGTTKIAILFLYLRLAVNKTLRIVIWGTMAFVAATVVGCVVAGLFQCNPIAFAWDKTITGGTCFNVTALFYSNAGLNIFQDVFIYILPMRMLSDIQIPRKQKVALIAVFAVGGFVCITGMLRLDSLRTASVSKDPTWDNFGSAIWSGIESNIGIVCASLPHFKPLLTRYFPSLMGLRSTSAMTPLSDGGRGKSGFRTPNADDNFQMVRGNIQAGPGYSVAVTGKSRSSVNSSEEYLRGTEGNNKQHGIYKTTKTTFNPV